MAWYNPTDPTKRYYMLGGILFLAALYPFYSYWLTPKNEENDTIRERVEELNRQNRQAGIIATQGGGDLEARLQLYERHVDRLEELIPTDEEVTVLLDDIQSLARGAGVDVQELNPEPAESAGPYDRKGYQMAVVGEYHSVARFLTEVANLDRIVNTVQMDMELFGQPESRPDMEDPVQATFRIETYVLPDPSTLPPAEMPGG